MTTFMLRSGHRAELPAQPLVVRVQGTGVESARHRVEVVGERSTPTTLQRLEMLVLPSLDQAAMVRVLPAGDGRFPPQSVLTIVIGPDGRDQDADRVLLDHIDVSGLAYRDLARLEPVGDRIAVTALGTVADTPLPERAEMARDATREVLGVPQAADADAVDLRVAVDVSLSMRQSIMDGTLEAALEFLAGMGSVIGAGRGLHAALCGQTIRPLESQPPEHLASGVLAALGSRPRDESETLPEQRTRDGQRTLPEPVEGPALTTGFRSSLAGLGQERALVYLITDGVPADLENQPSDGHPPHLVLLVPADFTDAVRIPDNVPVTIIPVGPLGRPTTLGTDRRQCQDIVGSLLASYHTSAGVA